ncbi:hypothetical protein [Thomasclavelia cocleata]|uniref:Uncharacterized protein n=1 Tax=Thomasclavelia cocleata TaxID=69824 RepID=A0A1I0EYH3_9FIRM|nr:hypothetical protein [Thomasclavelia cocleata]MCR1960359.1 hypothetical protein [Thomasclavelia cocleata]SET50529.1 hypothetical protein SAMN04489758_11529 [Thomasclavelia cocleata]
MPENIVFIYVKRLDCSIGVGRIGKLECDFILFSRDMNYSYVQVVYTIGLGKETENREYKPLERIKDNYQKYVIMTNYFLQRRNGIYHVNIIDFMNKKIYFKVIC